MTPKPTIPATLSPAAQEAIGHSEAEVARYRERMMRQMRQGPCSCRACIKHSRQLRQQFGIPDGEGAVR